MITRAFGYLMITAMSLYLINNYLVYWQNMPGSYNMLLHYGLFGLEGDTLDAAQLTRARIQVAVYLAILVASVVYVIKTGSRSLQQDSVRFARLSAYVIRLNPLAENGSASNWDVRFFAVLTYIIRCW